MAGVPGTASTIFSAVKDVGANVIMISQVFSVLVLIWCLDILEDAKLCNFCRLVANILCALQFLRRK